MKEFLYHIIDPTTGLYYYIDPITKQVLTNNDPVFLQHTPDGWEKKSIAFIRSDESYGVIKSFTIPLQFVLDGARILRYLLYTKIGMETLADLSIKKLNPATGQYLRYYRGELNFSEFEDSIDSVSVNVVEARIAKLIKANKATKYEFDLDTIPEAALTLMDGVELENIYHYTIPQVSLVDDRSTFSGFDVAVGFINKEGDSYGIAGISQDLQGELFVTALNPFLKNLNTNVSVTATLKGNLLLAQNVTGNLQIHILCQDSNNGNIISVSTIINQTCTQNVTYVPAINAVINMPPNSELKMWCTTVPAYPGVFTYPGYLDASKGYWNAATNTPALVNGVGTTGFIYIVSAAGTHDFGAGNITFAVKDYVTYSAGVWQKLPLVAYSHVYFENSLIDVSFTFRYAPTYVKTISAYVLGKLLIEKICGVGYSFVSNLLSSRPDIAITSGDGIRSLPNAKIKTSFDDFFKAVDCLLMAGLSYDTNTATLEKRDYFYDNTTEIFDVGNVEQAVLSQAKEYVFNTIKVGYAPQDTKFDEINGKSEFNTTGQYTTPITRIAKPYELVSTYRADMYGIEVIRINLDAKKTTSNSTDNDVFMLNIADDSPTLVYSFNAGNSFLVAFGTPISAGDTITIGGTSFNNGVKHVISVTNFVGLSGTISLLITIAEATFNEALVTGTLTNSLKKLYRKIYDNYTPINTSGLPFPLSAFNVEFSPKRMLLNHGSWITSIMYRLETFKIFFQTTDKNPNLITVDGGNVIKESGNLTIGNLAPRFFKPYIFKIKTSTPVNLVELTDVNKRGYVSFHWNGIKYRGFPMNIEIQPATLEEKEFELLCCPDIDLTNFNNFT